MKKRLLAMVLALVLVLGMLPVGVTAEGEHVHCLCGRTKTLDATCAACGTTAVAWTAWEATDSLPLDGHFYLTADVTAVRQNYKSANTAICLHGKDIKSQNGNKLIEVYNTATVSITDCEGTGKLTGCYKDSNGSTLRVNEGGVLNLYGGNVTGNSSPGDGIIYVDKSDSIAGGVFNMYGGVISGNTVRRGAVYGVSNGTGLPVIRILGGAITGNTGTGTNPTGGGAGLVSFRPVEIGGDAKIYGNTAKEEPADVFLRNDGTFTGKFVLSQDYPLEEGAQINYGTKTAEADSTNLQCITGTPTNWSPFWLTYNGQKVAYTDGKFHVDETVHHIHCLCGQTTAYGATCAKCGSEAKEWTAWDGTTAMNSLEAGNYYLTQDISIASVQIIQKDIAIDLCGHNITGSAKRAIYINGATMSITDCTDVEDKIGKITGFANESSNGPITIASGSVLNIYNGKIVNNTVNSGNCGVITVPSGAEFNMYGGEISGNTVVRGAIKGGTTATPYTIRILGGTITGNNGSGSGGLGGGAGIYSFSPVTVGGDAKVYGNTGADAAKNQDIFLRNDGTYTGKLIVSSSKPLEKGALINYGLWTAETDLTNLQKISGNPAKWESTWVYYEGQKVGYADGVFFIDTSAPEDHVHCLCGKETNLNVTCASCGTEAVEWTAWEATDSLPADGHFYLTADVTTGRVDYKQGNTAICLHGNDIKSQDGYKVAYVYNTATLSFTDCSPNPGAITGTYADTYGLTLRVDAGGVLNLYGGKVTGNTGTAKGDGIIYVDKGTASLAGGEFNMYGGEISGNTARRGIIFSVLSAGVKAPTVRILGGTITGNHVNGTGATSGGGAICTFNPVEIGGDAQIYGNTAAVADADNIFLRNDGYNGSLVISSEVPLNGANIHYGTKTPEADLTNLQYITGSPENWSMGWLVYDGEEVGYKNGKFFTQIEYIYSSHDHDGHKWISMTNANGQVPAASGHYVLDEDVTLPGLLTLSGAEITLCLNGHTLTAAEGQGHFDLQPGTKLTICDCAGGGVITGGKGANGGVIRAREGSQVYLYGGTITGNSTAGNGGFIYMNAASADHPAAAFYMYGGTICDNYGAMGAAVRLGAPAAGLAGPTFVMEGGTICCNESPSNGGAIHAASGGTIELRGGVIEGNSANYGGAISINGNTVVNLSGTVIRNNTAKTTGGGMYMLRGVLNMSGGQISDNTSNGAAGGVLILESTGSFTGGKISGNKAANGAGGGMNIQGCELTLGHMEISGNTSKGTGGGVYICRSGSINTHLTVDGTQIIGNTSAGSGGGIGVYMNGCTLTIEDGRIAENKAANGGGVHVQRICTVTLNGGRIEENSATANAGGLYASTESIFVMNGGRIQMNYAGKNGGGIYALRAKLTLNSGSVTANIAQNSVGGVYFSGSTGEINGTWITVNRALEGSGGGVMLSPATVTVNGVKTKFNAYVVMSAGSISYNTTPKAGAGLLIQSEGTVFDFYGGEISKNVATKFAGGVYVGSKATFNMHGGQVSYNVTENDIGGGIRHDGGYGNYTGGEIFGNTSTRSGGGIVVGGTGNKVTMKNVKIYDNTAKVAAGVIVQSKGCTLTMENCEIYNNKATQEGAGLYAYTYCFLNAKNCHIHDNIAGTNGGGVWSWATSYITLDNCLIENNQAVAGQGGAIWTRGDGFDIIGSTIRNNTAAKDGGAIYAGMMGTATDGFTPGMKIVDSVIEKNVSGGIGGGLYQSAGSRGSLSGVQFLNNTAAAEAGALWAKDEFAMHNVTATGNVSGGEGYAVYLDDSEYDGHSYVAGLMEMSGSMKIHDNPGGNLYLGKQTVLSITELGIAEDTRVEVTLHSGLLTQMVWGAFNYEGGDQIYTITYGNRSITDPEIPVKEETPTEDPTEAPSEVPSEGDTPEQPTEGNQEQPKGNGALIVGIGALVAVIAAAAIIIVLASKKKKSDK